MKIREFWRKALTVRAKRHLRGVLSGYGVKWKPDWGLPEKEVYGYHCGRQNIFPGPFVCRAMCFIPDHCHGK